MSVCKAFSCYKVGARDSGLGVDIFTWAVTHMGVGKGYWYRGMYRGLHWDTVQEPDPRLVL